MFAPKMDADEKKNFFIDKNITFMTLVLPIMYKTMQNYLFNIAFGAKF